MKAFSGADAYMCHCGAVGCLTTLASNSGLIKNKGMTLDEFAWHVRSGKEEDIALLQKIIAAIGLSLSNVVTFLNPDQVMLTGRVIEQLGDRIIPEVLGIVQQTVPQTCQNISLHPFNNDYDEAALAGQLVIKTFFDVPLDILSL
ncbi:ROK family protein [Bacillaceae bacterium SIJ1]|nr:ROK family protein [Litoribacterium kuwaitense]NGP44975.1 ROK family protein [Litoribacterium kuwaitense]